MNDKKNFFIVLFLSSLLLIMIINFYPVLVFDIFCNSFSKKELISIDTHGEENVDILYRFLFNKGKKINKVLEKIFLDQGKTNVYYYGISLNRGDVAWFLYVDINFNDAFWEQLLCQFNFSNGMDFSFTTLQNKELRMEIHDFFNKEKQ